MKKPKPKKKKRSKILKAKKRGKRRMHQCVHHESSPMTLGEYAAMIGGSIYGDIRFSHIMYWSDKSLNISMLMAMFAAMLFFVGTQVSSLALYLMIVPIVVIFSLTKRAREVRHRYPKDRLSDTVKERIQNYVDALESPNQHRAMHSFVKDLVHSPRHTDHKKFMQHLHNIFSRYSSVSVVAESPLFKHLRCIYTLENRLNRC